MRFFHKYIEPWFVCLYCDHGGFYTPFGRNSHTRRCGN